MLEIDFWQWLIIAGVLMGAEILVPGAFLLWIGLSALATGAIVYLFPDMPGMVGLLIFGVGSVIFALIGNKFMQSHRKETDAPFLNERGSQYIGQTVTVVKAIKNGTGKVRVGDTEWLAEGDDCEKGTEVQIIGVRDISLVVKPLENNNNNKK